MAKRSSKGTRRSVDVPNSTERESTGEEGATPPPKARSGKDSAIGWVKSIAIAFVLWIFLRALLVEAFHITSGSMENTLLVGDVLFVNKAVYGARLPVIKTRLPAFSAPQRGQVVIFESVEEPGLTVVKRIVGAPGDTIAMRHNRLLLNGQPHSEPYVVLSGDETDPADPRMQTWQRSYAVGDPNGYTATLKNWGPIVVPRDSFLVMGDNRDDSYDSRYWGFLGRDRVRGRAAVIYYSHDPRGILPLPWLTAIRWGRLFTLIR